MDAVAEIKARLSIEELVGQYVHLKRKGRGFVGLCPFHNDTTPSFTVSPDKGIAYCFPCQKGGDIFSFYQLIEGVDFPQALRDLAERTGVELQEAPAQGAHREERDRARACLEEALRFYREALQGSPAAQDYLRERGVTPMEIDRFEIGLAPDVPAALYDRLLKAGFSRAEVLAAGLAAQRDLAEARMYDRFRNRIMFPIRDAQGRLSGFGGRALGESDAKYLNTSETVLFRKSSLLYGLPFARDAIRQKDCAVVVEGYFDVIACHRCGATHAVATCGTALTTEHSKLLRRATEKVVLCLDSDRAGRAAAERAFATLCTEGLAVYGVQLPEKDAADLAQSDPRLLAQLLGDGGVPYIDAVLAELAAGDCRSIAGKRAGLERLLPLLSVLPTRTEQEHYVRATSAVLGVTESALEDDLRRWSAREAPRAAPPRPADAANGNAPFSSAEIALGLFLLYPHHRALLVELLPPEEEWARLLYEAMRALPADATMSIVALPISAAVAERAQILGLYCEQHGFGLWSDSLAPREIRRNCAHANRVILRQRQRLIANRLQEARSSGRVADEELLQTQYQQLLKLAHLAR